jgi:hypothetical protein
MSDNTFKPRADSGNLHAVQSKTNPLGKDYFGEIAINLKDMTNVRTEDGLTIIRLSGWKKVSKNGKTYLSLAVDRYIPKTKQEAPARPVPQNDFPDDDIPF